MIEGSKMRPADVLILSMFGNTESAVDVAVVSPVQNKYLREAAKFPLHSVTKYEQFKEAKYGKFTKNQGWSFFPFVVESSGAFGKMAQKIIKELKNTIIANQGNYLGYFHLHNFYSTYSTGFMKITVRSIINRFMDTYDTHMNQAQVQQGDLIDNDLGDFSNYSN